MINNFFKNKSINKLRYTVRWGGYDNTVIPKMIANEEQNGFPPNGNIGPGDGGGGNNGGGYTPDVPSVTGTVPLTVNFTDTSTGDNLSWLWNFGDGGSSTQQNPTYTFPSVGNYTVLLTATNNYGSDTKSGIVTVQSQGGGNDQDEMDEPIL
jgi:PKD repeat protein